MKNLFLLGFILVFIGFILIMFSSFSYSKTDVKAAGGIFLGPIPLFGFASDKKLLYILFGLGILIFILFEILRRFF